MFACLILAKLLRLRLGGGGGGGRGLSYHPGYGALPSSMVNYLVLLVKEGSLFVNALLSKAQTTPICILRLVNKEKKCYVCVYLLSLYLSFT